MAALWTSVEYDPIPHHLGKYERQTSFLSPLNIRFIYKTSPDAKREYIEFCPNMEIPVGPVVKVFPPARIHQNVREIFLLKDRHPTKLDSLPRRFQDSKTYKKYCHHVKNGTLHLITLYFMVLHGYSCKRIAWFCSVHWTVSSDNWITLFKWSWLTLVTRNCEGK